MKRTSNAEYITCEPRTVEVRNVVTVPWKGTFLEPHHELTTFHITGRLTEIYFSNARCARRRDSKR